MFLKRFGDWVQLNQGILLTVLITTASILLCLGIFLAYQKYKKSKDPKEVLARWLLKLWYGTLTTIFLPWVLFKAIFFVYAKNGDGTHKRVRFSLTRSVFALASFTMLFRLMVGGVTVDNMTFGPNVEVPHSKKKVVIKKPKKKRRLRTKTVTKNKFRPWGSIAKVSAVPVHLYEILLYLIIVGLYYFRRDLNEGDKRGILDQMIELFGRAYALKISGTVTPGVTSPSPPIETTVTETVVVETEKKSRRNRRRRRSLLSEEDDPFLK